MEDTIKLKEKDVPSFASSSNGSIMSANENDGVNKLARGCEKTKRDGRRCERFAKEMGRHESCRTVGLVSPAAPTGQSFL